MELVDFATMMEAPIGRYAHRSPFLAWAVTPKLCGITYVGRVGDEHLPVLRASGALPFHPDLVGPYSAVIDCSRITEIGAGVFTFLVDHMRELRAQCRLARVAVLRPPGLAGAASIGLFHEHFEGHVEVAFTADMTEALAYVAASASDTEAILAMLDDALVRPALVDQLRRALADDPRLSLAVAARQLAMTPRALQRALHDARTSFRAEAARGRFAHALSALSTSADKIEVVARQAGYASALNFARRVRQEYGVTPSELRQSLQTAIRLG